MSTDAGTEAPTKAPCWPGDRDYLDGRTEIELSTRHLEAYWDADIIDVDDKNKHDRIIGRNDPFEIRFRVELVGRLWRCICGHWCFKVGFAPVGVGLPHREILYEAPVKLLLFLCLVYPVI